MSRDPLCHSLSEARARRLAGNDAGKVGPSFEFNSLSAGVAQAGAAIVALDGHYLCVSRELECIIGYSEGELKTRVFTDILHSDDRAAALDAVRRLIAGEIDRVEDNRRLIVSCVVVHVRWSMRLMRSDAGQPLYFLQVITTIPKHGIVNAEKRPALGAVLDELPIPLFFSEYPENLEVLINKAGRDLLQRPQDSLLSPPLELEADVDVVPRVVQGIMKQAIDQARPLNPVYLTLKSPSGKGGGLLGSVAPLGRGDSDPWGAVAAFIDVTALKWAELKAESDRRLAEHANAAKSAFLSNVSHELRSPLASMIGFAEAIKDQRFGPVGAPTYLDYAKDIQASGEHLLELVNLILDIAKIEAGKMTIEPIEIGTEFLVQSAFRRVHVQARQRQVALIADVHGDAARLWADERAANQILDNLLSNAVKFTSQGGQITVGVDSDSEGGIRITVRDNGVGIPAEYLPNLMRPFEQVDNSYGRTQGGTGLGLALVKGLVELHGGSVAIDSTLGVGTTVTVHFPHPPAGGVSGVK